MAKANSVVVEELMQGIFKDRTALKRMLETLVNEAMDDELARRIGAGRYERNDCRRGRRNGYKARSLKSLAGELALSVPQVRDSDPYHPSMFNRWQRSERALLVACGEMYFQGVSTRKVRAVLKQMCGVEVSPMVVSRVAGELDEKLSVFRGRRLDGVEYPYIKIDARYEKVRVNGHG